MLFVIFFPLMFFVAPSLLFIFLPFIFAVNLLPYLHFAYYAYKGRAASLPILRETIMRYL